MLHDKGVCPKNVPMFCMVLLRRVFFIFYFLYIFCVLIFVSFKMLAVSSLSDFVSYNNNNKEDF